MTVPAMRVAVWIPTINAINGEQVGVQSRGGSDGQDCQSTIHFELLGRDAGDLKLESP